MPIVLVLLAVAGAAPAQTYVPGQTQQMLNQAQLNMQSLRLEQLQRQTTPAMQSGNPAAMAQAAALQAQIRQQTDQTNALRQQMLSPSADPAFINGQIQLGGARTQGLQTQAPIP